MTKSELFDFLEKNYFVKPEFLWEKFPEYAVFRHKNNRKWFAIFMPVDGRKISNKLSGKIETLTIKTEPNLRAALLEKEGMYPAYHMNKAHWITLVLSEISDEDFCALIDISFEMTK